jgi:thioesterase domain-containing protein
VLAFEIARQLQILGKPAKGLLLLDSPFPIDHEPLPDTVVEHVAGTAFKAHPDIRSCVEAQFKRNAGLLKGYRPPRHELQIPTVMLLSREACDAATLCGLKYAWLDEQEFRKNTTKEWSTIVGKSFETMEVEGNHFNMFGAEHVSIPGVSGDVYMC